MQELRAAIPRILSVCEELNAAVAAIHEENRRLRDEILRLKGEHGSPPRSGGAGGKKGSVVRPVQEHSTEAERRNPKTWRKCSKRETLRPDRETPLLVDRDGLPADAEPKGFVRYLVQDIVVRRETVAFLREKFYSPGSRKTYLAPLPPGYHGAFGPGLRALALELGYGANVSFPQIHGFLTRRGIRISRGKISALLTRGLCALHTEASAVLEAGLGSTPWQQLDVTGTPVGGVWQACHTVGNPLYSFFRTTPSQDRLSVLNTLRGGRSERFRLDEAAFERLADAGIGPRTLAILRRLPHSGHEAGEWARDDLTGHLLRLGKQARASVLEAAALSAYRAASDWPVVRCLLGDDAGQFRELTAELALCWVHDARHYKKLDPAFHCFRRELDAFMQKYWEYYRKLLAYREAPSAERASELGAEFDTLFKGGTGYAGLERCIARTRGNKAKLLLVLRHPELPLHNNASELAARRRVIKRRASHGPKTEAGAKAWDTFHTLAATTAKLGVSFADYLEDRLLNAGQVPWLPGLITNRAQELKLGWSWETT